MAHFNYFKSHFYKFDLEFLIKENVLSNMLLNKLKIKKIIIGLNRGYFEIKGKVMKIKNYDINLKKNIKALTQLNKNLLL